jgi:hypothetical protein
MTAAVLATVFALPLSAPAAADVGDKDVVRVKLTGVPVSDPGRPFVPSGDSWVTYLHLYNLKKQFVGDASARCSAVKASGNRVTAQCTRVLRLKDGELTLHDMITRVGNKRVTAKTAIAGGTGVYNDAEGEGYIILEHDRVRFDLHVDD